MIAAIKTLARAYVDGLIFRCGRDASQAMTSLSSQAILVARPPGPISRASGNFPARIQEKMLQYATPTRRSSSALNISRGGPRAS